MHRQIEIIGNVMSDSYTDVSGGMDLKNGLSVPVVFLLLICMAAEYAQADNLSYREDDNLTFNLNQMVSGTGYFATYKHILMPDALGSPGRLFNGVESAGSSHGSGTIKADANIYAESYYIYEIYKDIEYDDEGDPIEELEESDSIININEESDMLFSPNSIAIGSRFYAHHPVVFNSLLKDAACIKNRDGLNSINNRVEEAHGLKKAIDIQADYSSTVMKVDEDVTAGRIHIGVLQLAGIPVVEEEDDEEGGDEEESEEEEIDEESDVEGEIEVLGLAIKDWKNPQIELEEDYIGTFHIVKNISLITDSLLVEKDEEWLPCCGGGWEDMLYYDQKGFGKSTRGVFDCTCSDVAKEA
jgi:hypothetical protein